ncbi:MAG TPA: FtsQ-type POTRA domain-containing protein [Propioniciclava sp.]|uniref:cell division protein FtsQ/DivIB n=1 Tax=Propioniciclava sp. TaxID=2038686 RepID=UPI002BA450F3|nr:FtsQ-type POTRA domain-containing protein [Propioniciclava sp.]HRL48785.1 FtsQ-type POTRA domain-containing protein [Propioniciclava sp.]HRL78804.1 FtsQ-type POTRA domain-containing protein [Propioniciclava sp.]
MSEPLVDVTGARKRRGRAKRRRWLKRAGLAALVGALLAGIAWVVWGSPWLLARQVEVTGVAVVTTQDVVDAASVPLGTPLAAIDAAGIEARVVDALPAVAAAKVSRVWPGTVSIAVTERQAVLAVPLSREFLWVSADGVIFHRTSEAPAGVLTATSGIANVQVIGAMAAVAAALPEQVRSQASTMSAASQDSIVVTLSDGRKITWGSADESELKARVVVPLLGVKAREYDVSAPTHPTTR